MKDINREGILRMIGMRDTAGFLSKINALFIDIYDEGGKLAEYSTQLIVTSKNITLLAQRVTDTETGIANLTVQYNQISATVTSINTTVGGHTTQIGQLQVTAQQLTASVSSLTTTVNGHTTSIGQLQITADNLTASVSSLNTTVSGHTTSIGQLQITSNSISNRVTVIEGDYVKEAEISLMVKKDGNGYISNASIKADNIDFTFTRSTNFISNGTTVMNINSSGDLWILGNLKGGNIQGNYIVGTTGNKMEIYVDEVSHGYITTSGLRGFDSNRNQLLNLRVTGTSATDVQGELYLYSSSNYTAIMCPQFIGFNHPNNGGAEFGWFRDKIYIYGGVSHWPTLSQTLAPGQVYLDNGYLKVRTS